MTTKIFLGTLLFMIIFAATGLVLLNEGVLPDQAKNGTGRMQIETQAQAARSIESGALIFLTNCSTCHGPNGEGVPGKGPTLNPDLFTKHFPALKAAKYEGTLHDFVELTAAAGRPVPSTYAESLGGFPAPMPTWSQQFGGPLRVDQIDDVTNFVLNWEAQATASQTATVPGFTAIGADLAAALPAGNPARGADLFAQKAKTASGSALPCKSCHSLQPNTVIVGPSLSNIGTAGATMEPGKTAEQYIRESIQSPSAFIVPGNPAFVNNGKSVMPAGLGNTMSAQDLADLIAYLLTLH